MNGDVPFRQRGLELALLAAVLLLALGLRLYRLDAQSLWNDEGTSVALAQRDLATIARNAAADIHPPLYYYLLHFWVGLAGTSEFAVRSLSALGGAALVAGTYLLARRLFGAMAGLIAALFSAVSPFQVYYSQETRMYIAVTLLGLLSMLAYERLFAALAHARPALGWAALYGLSTLVALYTQYYAFALLLAQNVGLVGWLLWCRWKRRIPWRRVGRLALGWGALQAAILLCYLPWLTLAWPSLRNWPAVGERLSPVGLALDVVRHFALGPTTENRARVRLASLALWLLALPGLWPLAAKSEQEKEARGAALMLLYLLVPILAMIALSLSRPMYKPKLLLLATPPFYILQAQGIIALGRWVGWLARARWAQEGLGALLATVVCIAQASPLAHLYHDPRYARDNYRAIVAYIQATAGPQDAILINAPTQIETVNYYYNPQKVKGALLTEYPLPEQRPINTAHAEAALEHIVARHARIYAILWATQEGDPERFIEGWLDRRCYKAMDSWFGNVRLAVYAVPIAPTGAIAHPANDTLGQNIHLLGHTLLTPQPRPGDILQLTLFWQATAPIAERYKVFVHLVDAQGRIVAQRDSEPVGDSRITSAWPVGEVIADNYGLLIPPGSPAGEYSLRVGMYGLFDGRRLPVSRAGQGMGDFIELGRVSVGGG